VNGFPRIPPPYRHSDDTALAANSNCVGGTHPDERKPREVNPLPEASALDVLGARPLVEIRL